jgi:hypothetical protein
MSRWLKFRQAQSGGLSKPPRSGNQKPNHDAVVEPVETTSRWKPKANNAYGKFYTCVKARRPNHDSNVKSAVGVKNKMAERKSWFLFIFA